MEMQFLLIAFIVSLGLTFVQPNNHRISGGNDGSNIDENFHSLFDSIRKNDAEETETYRNALEQEAIKERQAFDTMKEQLQVAGQRSAQKQMSNSYDKNAADIDEKSSAFKREVSDFSGDFPDTSLLDEAEKIHKKHSAPLAPFEEPIEMCRGMQNLDIDSFIKDITHSFQDSCADFLSANESEYQHLYNIVLTLAGYRLAFANENTTNICVKSDSTIFLMEFAVNSTGQKALARTEWYRRIVGDADDEYYYYRDVLCLGINYVCSRIAEKPEKIQLSCDWAANLYSWNGKCAVKSGNAGPVIHDIKQLEDLFLELHPKTDDIPWKEMANLTEDSLKDICDQMLPVLVPSAKNYTYDGSLDYSDFRLERMVQYALLRLKNQMVEVPAYAPIIKCFYKEIKFYLTHAADGMVFEVQCEDADQEIYLLKSGPYRVNVPK